MMIHDFLVSMMNMVELNQTVVGGWSASGRYTGWGGYFICNNCPVADVAIAVGFDRSMYKKK